MSASKVERSAAPKSVADSNGSTCTDRVGDQDARLPTLKPGCQAAVLQLLTEPATTGHSAGSALTHTSWGNTSTAGGWIGRMCDSSQTCSRHALKLAFAIKVPNRRRWAAHHTRRDGPSSYNTNGRPVTSVVGTAISCLAMMPASQASRPPSMARRKARAMVTGS